MAESNKDKLSSLFGTYMTILGYSCGMADVWRFPFLAYRNGGGAFLIPFLITILLCGIPMFYIEFGLGKFSGKGPYLIWNISPVFRGTGLAILVAYFTYLFGTMVIRCWMFQFCFYTFRDPLPWTTCDNSWNTLSCRMDGFQSVSLDYGWLGDNASLSTAYNDTNASLVTTTSISDILISKVHLSAMTAEEEFWQYNVLELSSGLTHVYPLQWRYIALNFVWRVAVAVVVMFGIRGIEKVMYVTAMLPILISLAVLVRSLMLPGAVNGIYHFFYPDMSRMLDAKIWIEAFVMGFYTIGFGWGCIIMLGSCTRFKENISTVATLCPILDALMAIFQGMLCFSVLGNMAASRGVDVENVMQAGLSTGIVAYVTALSALPVPQLWSFLFFVSLTTNSLESQIIPIEMCVQVLREVSPYLKRKKRAYTVIGFSAVMFVLSLPTCTGAGAYMLLLVDWYAGAWSGPIVAFVEVFVIAWVYGLDGWNDDVRLMTGRAMSLYMHVGIGFTTPVILLVIFLVSVVKYVPPVYGSYTYPVWARLFGWLIVGVVMSPIVITAMRHIYKETGTVVQRVKRSVLPNDEWGPADTDASLMYKNTKEAYIARSFKDLARYNITRTRKGIRAAHGRTQELTELM